MLEEQEEAARGLRRSKGPFEGETSARCGGALRSLPLHLGSGTKGKKGGLLQMLPWSHGSCSVVRVSGGSTGEDSVFSMETHGRFPSFLSFYKQVLKKPTETHPISC